MALRTPLSVTPHLYMGDSTGRPLDMGTVYFGEQDKDPEFYPIELFSDDALTLPLAQPVHTKGGYLYDKGDMVEPHAKELIYSVKVLDSYGRKVFYKGAMMRNSWNDDVIQQINTAIIGSADVARQVATDITNDAINNTAVEGGVLADTFVTATANELGSVARTQRSKNNDTVSIKDFGSFGDGADWTSAFHLAAATGKEIVLPEGRYSLKTNDFDCAAKNLVLRSDGGAEIILIQGTARNAFNITNSNKVVLNNVIVSSTNDSYQYSLLSCSPTSLINSVELESNTIVGNVALLRAGGSYGQLPSVTPFGFKRLIFNKNKIIGTRGTVVSIPNFPVWYSEFSGNEVKNMGNALINMGISSTVNNKEILSINTAHAHNNIVINDDDHYSIRNGIDHGPYHCFIIFEGHYISWVNNTIEGLKSKEADVTVCDAYLASKQVVSKGNTIRNIGNFSSDVGLGTSRNLIHAKAETGNRTRLNIKHITNNTYIIEDEWLARIGFTESVHNLFNIGFEDGGDVTITDNYFDLSTLRASIRCTVTSLMFDNNTIKAKRLIPIAGQSNAPILHVELKGSTTGYIGSLDVSKNILNVDNVQTGVSTTFLTSASPQDVKGVNNLVCLDNYIDIKDPASPLTFISGVRADKAEIHRNIVNGNVLREFTSLTLESINASNNIYTATAGGKLRTFEYLKLAANTNIKQTYHGIPNWLGVNLPITATGFAQGDTLFRVRVNIANKTGDESVSFKFSINNNAGVLSLKWTDSLNEQKVTPLRSASDNGGTLLSVNSGEGGFVLSVAFVNNASTSEIKIQGMSTSLRSEYTLNITSFAP